MIPKGWQDSGELVDMLLYQRKVFIAPGFIFGTGGDRYVRISLCADEEVLMEGLSRIKEQIPK